METINTESGDFVVWCWGDYPLHVQSPCVVREPGRLQISLCFLSLAHPTCTNRRSFSTVQFVDGKGKKKTQQTRQGRFTPTLKLYFKIPFLTLSLGFQNTTAAICCSPCLDLHLVELFCHSIYEPWITETGTLETLRWHLQFPGGVASA